jgi:hypothetical protein
VQTAYVVAPSGEIDARQRTLDAQTAAPARPLTREEKLKVALIGVGVAFLVFAVSAVFVDYGAVLRNVADSMRPLDASSIRVDASAFERYFAVEKVELGRGKRYAVLTLRRSREFPLTEGELDSLAAGVGGSIARRLALEAVAAGYVRCEMHGEKDGFVAFTTVSIKGLREADATEVAVPLPRSDRPALIVLTY